MSFARALKDIRHRLFYALISSARQRTATLGDRWTWTIAPDGLASNSVVYCAGVGDDISFEKDIVKQYDCEVLLLDPSPTGIATMRMPENQSPRFQFQAVGLADYDGEIVLGVPEEPTKASYFLTSSPATGISFPCSSLSTLMQNFGHTAIDLLKLDIEGFEYGVLNQICSRRIPIRQICVEFHHSIVPGIARSETIKTILRLRRAGYQLINLKDWDHTFLKC